MQPGVIFDMDGVLVDSGPPHAESWRVLAGKHGLCMSDRDFADTFGQTSRDIIRRFWGARIADDQIQRLDDEKERIYRESIRGAVPLMPGVIEMLSALRDAGYKMAVATSGPPENAELALNEGRLRKFFSAVITGFDIEKGKPAPDCFLLAAARAKLTPEKCVVVEDAPVGVQAALAAGMKAIGYIGTHPAAPLSEAGAALTLAKLTKITPDIIRGLLI